MRTIYCFIISLFLGFTVSFHMYLEDAVLISLNKKYIANGSTIFVSRHGKTTYLNMIGTNIQTWDNNVTINIVLYEFIRNEYRRSYIGFHFRVCDMLHSDPYIGAMVAKTGLTCPVYSKTHKLVNMTIPTFGDYKYVIFYKKCMVELEISVTSTGESMGKANLYFNITK